MNKKYERKNLTMKKNRSIFKVKWILQKKCIINHNFLNNCFSQKKAVVFIIFCKNNISFWYYFLFLSVYKKLWLIIHFFYNFLLWFKNTPIFFQCQVFFTKIFIFQIYFLNNFNIILFLQKILNLLKKRLKKSAVFII